MFGSSFRKRPPTRRSSSLASETDDDRQYERRMSIKPKSSATSGRMPRRSTTSPIIGGSSRQEKKWFRMREYLLLLIEAFLSLSVYVVRQRNYTSDEVLRIGLTSRLAEIYMHYADGHSSYVSLIFGVLADSYISHYSMALFSVIVHFASVCLVFMEDTVKKNQHFNPYAELVRNVVIAAMILIKSTDFTRTVYGVEGMADRKTSTVHIFIFFQFFVSTYATYGGIIINLFGAVFLYFKFNLVIVAFVLSGISLFIFVYFLHPDNQDQKGLGCKVIGCLLLATCYRVFGIRKRGRRGFFSNTEGTCSKNTIARTKEILILYCMFLPAIAIAVLIMVRGNVFFEVLIKATKVESSLLALGLRQMARATISVTMLLSNFVIWPLLVLAGLKNRNTTKFLIGHMLTTFAFVYAAWMTRISEQLQFPPGTGLVRVFNTRDQPVYFTPMDDEFTTHPFVVDPKSGVMVSYPCSRPELFAMNVWFNGTTTNYTMYLSVIPQQTIGYMVLEPPEVIRIRGPCLPLREGPAGTNEFGWARVYIYNTAKTLDGVAVDIRFAHTKRTQARVTLWAGEMSTIQLPPKFFEFSIYEADIKVFAEMEGGAVYGMMIFSTLSTREMVIDKVLLPIGHSIWPLLGLTLWIGLGYGFCYPALRAMVYTLAPQGLMGMSFAFLAFLEGMASWFLYIGCTTWHPYVTGNVLFAYAAGTAISLFLCMFVFLKNKDRYT